MSTDGEPWDQQPGESGRAYDAFVVYRDLGTSRSLPEVARRTAKSLPLMKRWSARHRWRDRILAWNAELARRALDDEAERRKDMNQFHTRGGRWMAQKALLRVVGNEEQGYRPLDVNSLTADQVVRLWEAGVKAERLGLGDSTDNIGHVDPAKLRAEAAALAAQSGLPIDRVLDELDKILAGQ